MALKDFRASMPVPIQHLALPLRDGELAVILHDSVVVAYAWFALSGL